MNVRIWWSVLVGGLEMGLVGAVPTTRDVRISLEAEGTTFPLGESVTLDYRIENLLHAPLFIIRSGGYRLIRPKLFEV